MEVTRVGRVVMYVSPDGVKNWELLKPEDVPQWLQNPAKLGEMLKGYLGHRLPEGVVPGSPEDDQPWYAAVTIDGTEADPAILNRAPVRPDPIHVPVLKYITPDDGSVPRELRVPPAMGEAENIDVGLDAELQRHGITRTQMLGDGGNPVPGHPGLESPKEAEASPVCGETLRPPKLELVHNGPSPVPE